MEEALQIEYLGVEDFLAGEETSLERHEYIDGVAYAMAGATDSHNEIAGNIFATFRAHLRGGPCRIFISDLKVRIRLKSGTIFYYPDVLITCDPRESNAIFKDYPKLIIEVLSDSTERTDRSEKFLNYTQIESLEEYVLVAQNRTEVTIFRRAAAWTAEVFRFPKEVIHLNSVQWSGRLGLFYEGIEFSRGDTSSDES